MDLMGRFFANLPLCLIGLYLIIMLHRSFGQKTTLLLKRVKSNRRAPIKMSTESLRTMILNSEMIIDRSLFIKEVLEHPEKRIIIALPPKWSKSLNLNMLKTFLQVEVDRAGHKVPFLNKTFAYKLFKKGIIYNETQNESLQAPFLISQHDDFIEKHLGQHPVVYMRLKMIEGLNDVAAFNSIKYVISQAFLPHRYLMNVLIDNHKITNENDTVKREKIQSYFFRFKSIMDESETSEEKLTGSLTFLCKLLYRQHRKRIYVLIDDYDVPFYKLLHSEYIVQSDFDHIMKYIEKVISPIIAPDCPYVERVIMTSTHHVTDIMGPHADSMAGYTLANNPWIEYFAITDREQQQLCKEWGKTDYRCRSAIGWYMGYRSSLNTSLNIGSPYSTAHFLAENNIKLYLFYKTRFDYMYSFIRIRTLREIIHSLINNNTVTIESFNDLRFSRADLTRLKEFAIASCDEGIPQSTIDLVLSYLCATGYLTFLKPNATATTAQAWIPNIETQSEMCKKLKPFYHKAYGLTYDHIENVVEKLRDYVMNDDYKHLKAMHQQLSILFNQSGINNVTSFTPDAEQYLSDLLYAALNYIAIKLRSVWKFDCVVWKEGTPPVSYMLGYMQAYGVVIATQHNEEAPNLWAMAKKHKSDLQKCPRVQLSKFIGFAIDESKTLHVRSTSEYIERTD